MSAHKILAIVFLLCPTLFGGASWLRAKTLEIGIAGGPYKWTDQYAPFFGWKDGNMFGAKAAFFVTSFLKFGGSYNTWESRQETSDIFGTDLFESKGSSNWQSLCLTSELVFLPNFKLSPYAGIGLGGYKRAYSITSYYNGVQIENIKGETDWRSGYNCTLGVQYRILPLIWLNGGITYHIIPESNKYLGNLFNSTFVGVSIIL